MEPSLAYKGSLAALLLGLALLWLRPRQLLPDTRLHTVIHSLIHYEANRPLEDSPRVAVGYGACRDLFVSGAFLMENQSFPEQPGHFQDVQDKEQLRRMYAYFFQAGAAAERFVSGEVTPGGLPSLSSLSFLSFLSSLSSLSSMSFLSSL